MKKPVKQSIVFICILVIINILSSIFAFQWDLTADKRFTLTKESLQVLKEIKHPLQIDLYLNGEMTSSFYKLQTGTIELLHEMAKHTPYNIKINNMPHPKSINEEQAITKLTDMGIHGTVVNDSNAQGKNAQQLIFPEANVIYNGDTIAVDLLLQKNHMSPQEITNASENNLEYAFTDALHLLTKKATQRIAFIEGQGELPDTYVYEATNALSKYYQIDRGKLTDDPSTLSAYKVLIIAGPEKPFSESDKYILDQYLMHGGSIFWLVDGIKINEDKFQTNGESPTIKNELNIDNLLSSWGVKINALTVQDRQCTPIRIATQNSGAKGTYNTLPWFFAPLLQPNTKNPITAHLSPLKSEMVSSISVLSNKIHATELLSTSNESHILQTPEAVSLKYLGMPTTKKYFSQPSQPIAILLEGRFPSAYAHASRPSDCKDWPLEKRNISKPTRQIVAASASIIQNEWSNEGEQSQPLPLGYDQLTGQRLGNQDFIVNAVNYLAGNGSWLQMRNKKSKVRLLSKESVMPKRLVHWQALNIGGPILAIVLICVLMGYLHKKE